MEPISEAREILNSKLDLTLRKISAYIAHANTRRETFQIENFEDFVFGMIYQAYFKKCVDYHVQYVKEHSDSTPPPPAIDMSGIGDDIFETRANEIRKLISARLHPQN